MAIITDSNQALIDNQAFLHSLNVKGVEKAAGAMTDFVRVKIRELSFARKILPPQNVTSTDLVPDLYTDQPRRIVEMDIPSTAYSVTFLDQAMEKYYKGKKFPVYYVKYESEKFVKPVEEIMTYRTPIKTIVQENYLKDLQAAEDGAFIQAVDAIIADREAALPGDALYTVSGPLKPGMIAEGLKKLVNKKVPTGTILINEMDFLDLLKLEQASVGSSVVEDIIVNGFSYTKLLGQTFIRTIKHEVVAPGNIYLFTTPDYLGVFDILTDVKAFIKQEASMLEFYLYESVGMAIGNVNGVAKITLT